MRLTRSMLVRSSVLFVLLGLAGNAAAADVDITERAREHFRAGVSFLQDPDGARYEEAYREFKAAYGESPSWKILGNLGIAAMKLERDGEAVDAYTKYLAEGGDAIDPAERAQVSRDLEAMKAGMVMLTLSSTPAGASFIDERMPNRGTPVTNQYAAGPSGGPITIGVRPGVHRIRARLNGYEEAVWEIDAQPRSEQSHAFELKKPTTGAVGGSSSPADAGTRPVPTSVYVGLGTTAALGIGSGVMGALAMSKKGDFDDANDGSDPNAAESLHDDTQTFNLVSDILLGATVVSAGVTAYLYFTRPTVPSQTASITWTPVVTKDAGFVSVNGRF